MVSNSSARKIYDMENDRRMHGAECSADLPPGGRGTVLCHPTGTYHVECSDAASRAVQWTFPSMFSDSVSESNIPLLWR